MDNRLITMAGVLLSTGFCSANPYSWASNVVPPAVNSSGWTGQVVSGSGYYGGYGLSTLTPFDAAFTTASTTTSNGTYNATLMAVAPGSSLELAFGTNGGAATSNSVNGGFTIGIHAGVGLNDANYGSGQTGSVALDYNNPREATVGISQNGTNWEYLQYNGVTGSTAVEPNPVDPSLYQWVTSASLASVIAFDIPSNYFNSSTIGPDGNYAPNTVPAGTPVADFSKPFLGTLNSFSSESWSQVINTLNGSAGGTWLDVSGSGLNSINYIDFAVPSTASYSMYVQAVVGVATPEPTSLSLLVVGGLALLGRRRFRSAFDQCGK